jgi:eukaryotic-like serine/threonine-protein kinase
MRGLDRDMFKRFATAREMGLALERAVQLAPPSEVGEWVEANAGHRLSERADCIAEIESSSSSHAFGSGAHVASRGDGAVPESRQADLSSQDLIPIDVGAEATHPSQLSSISVSTSGAPGRLETPGVAHGRRVLWLIASGAVGAVLATLLVVSLSARPSEPAAPRPVATEAPPSTVSEAPPAPVASTNAEPSALVVAPSAPSAISLPPATTTAMPPKRQPTRAPAPANGSCDPPFTLDAVGHKHYKVECL